MTYQKQLLRQKQQRLEAGPKRLGRPFKNTETEEKRRQLTAQEKRRPYKPLTRRYDLKNRT